MFIFYQIPNPLIWIFVYIYILFTNSTYLYYILLILKVGYSFNKNLICMFNSYRTII